MTDDRFEEEPCYVISIAAKLVSLHPQTLRYYDRIGLIRPSRSTGRIRLYSQRDIETLRKVARLTDELGVNLAGVEVILNMAHRIEDLQQELAALQRQALAEAEALRQRLRELEEKERARHEYGIIRITTDDHTSGPGEAARPRRG
jgi:MerR family transcriptional regulator, heat shock protein HspR